jgi:hypothetical protein
MGRKCSTYGDRIGADRVSEGKHEIRDHVEDLDEHGKLILKLIFENGRVAITGLIRLRTGTGGGHL